MATRAVLAGLAADWTKRTGIALEIESVGGVDAAKRVQAGEAFDVVFLAADAIEKLINSGHVLAGSRADLMLSLTAVAVPAGTPDPDISSEAALKNAVLAARSIGYSTGPSGVALQKLFERWGVAEEIKTRTVQAPAGVPVGALIAKGDVALGFQQVSELIHIDGIRIVGPLSEDVKIVTTFSGAVCAASSKTDQVRALLAFMASDAASDAKQRQGMQPIQK